MSNPQAATPGLTGVQSRPQLGAYGRRIHAAREGAWLGADDFLHTEAAHSLEGLVDPRDATRRVRQEHRVGVGIDGGGEPPRVGCGLGERRRREPLGGDVANRAEEPHGAAILHRRSANRANPDVTAGGGDEGELKVEWAPRSDGVLGRFAKDRPCFGSVEVDGDIEVEEVPIRHLVKTPRDVGALDATRPKVDRPSAHARHDAHVAE